MRKLLNVLAWAVLSIGLILGLLASASLKGLGFSVMMTGGLYDPVVHGVPELANWFLILGVFWPLWAIVALGLTTLAEKFPAN